MMASDTAILLILTESLYLKVILLCMLANKCQEKTGVSYFILNILDYTYIRARRQKLQRALMCSYKRCEAFSAED